MKRLFVSLCLFLQLTKVVFASSCEVSDVDSCYLPFANMSKQFYLQAALDCDGISKTYKLAILDQPEFTEINNDIAYLGPECWQTEAMNIYRGKVTWSDCNEYDHMLHWSDNVVGDDPSVFKINRTCDGSTIAIVDTNPQDIKLVSGEVVKAYYRIFADDAQQSLIAYAAANDFNSNLLVLRDPNGEVLSESHRKYLFEDNQCFYNWNNTINNESALDPTAVAYLVAMRQNSEFSCPTATSAPSQSPSFQTFAYQEESNRLSGGVIAGISTAATAVVCTLGVCVYKKFFKKPSNKKSDATVPTHVTVEEQNKDNNDMEDNL